MYFSTSFSNSAATMGSTTIFISPGTGTSTVPAVCSTSLVDNVEHIFVPKLAPGRYDLQVLMNVGGLSLHNNAEPYALAYAFTSTALGGALDGSRLTLTWPVYPAGFYVEAATNLSSPAWSTNQLPAATLANGQNVLVLNRTNATQFFRLRQTP